MKGVNVMNAKKLTSSMLKKLIEEEVKKFGDMESTEDRAEDTEETEADELADALAKKIDYVKALKIEETRLRTRLQRIVEAKTSALKSLRSSSRNA